MDVIVLDKYLADYVEIDGEIFVLDKAVTKDANISMSEIDNTYDNYGDWNSSSSSSSSSVS